MMMCIIPNDAITTAFLPRITAGARTPAVINSINYWAKQYRAARILTKVTAHYPMLGATAANCSLNLIANTFTITWTNTTAANFTANGFVSSGSSFGNTNIAGNGLVFRDVSVGFYSRTNNSSAVWDVGAKTSNTRVVFLGAKSSFQCYSTSPGGNTNLSSNSNSSGFFTAVRRSSSAGDVYRNGTSIASVGTDTGNGTQPAAANTYRIGAVVGETSTGRTYCSFTFATAFSSAEESIRYTIEQNTQTILGRQV